MSNVQVCTIANFELVEWVEIQIHNLTCKIISNFIILLVYQNHKETPPLPKMSNPFNNKGLPGLRYRAADRWNVFLTEPCHLNIYTVDTTKVSTFKAFT